MAREKAVSDEKIIAAILSNGTFQKAAQACGISDRTIRERMKDPDFRAAYKAAKDDYLRAAVVRLDEDLTGAIDVVAEIMKDKDVNPAIRLQAAQTIINNATKLSSKLTADEYNTRVENRSFEESVLDDLVF